jgi:HK97 family phage prohead protease
MTTQTLNFSLELKALSDGQFEGHGSIFGNVDLGGDIVVPGAFKRSLAQHRKDGSAPQMFWMHDPSRVAGKWDEVREDTKGLYVKGTLAPTPLGDEMRALLKMNAVRGLSIGYRTRESDWDDEGNRLLKEVDLWEISLVSLAMNPLAQVTSAKSRLSDIGEYVPTTREFEHILRDAGCSKSVAKRLCAKLFEPELSGGTLPKLGRRDDGEADDQAADLLKSLNGLYEKVGTAVITTK